MKCKNTIRLVVRMHAWRVSDLPLLGMSIISVNKEEGIVMTLTIYHDGQYWVGIVEVVEKGKLKAFRHVFGTEPKEEDILLFIHGRLSRLLDESSQPGVGVAAKKRGPINPKRLQRLAAKEMKKGISTKAQEAMKEALEHKKVQARIENRIERDRLQQLKYEKKKQKAKARHRGK